VTLFVLLTLAFLPAPSHGEAGAHGGDQPTQPATAKGIHQPGPAVVAPRTTQIYAKPGMTLNPVAIDFDNKGNIYVAEGWRMGKGAPAIVHGPMVSSNSLPLDLQRTTIEQRAEHIESLIKGGYFEREDFTGRADQLRLVKDSDGDGIADQSNVFAGGFNDKLDGVASGVLWHDNKLLFACVPHLWLLEDKDGDGDADKETQGERTSLSYGYGLRWGYGGHDLHGLIKGPDGRIYFTMGDRGYNIQTQEGERLIGTDVGSVFRMWPDGSGLEIFATGLRNPQELAFDNYGNLFTGDNNCDAGDLARFCYIPEGSDAGWRQDVQSMDTRGVWMREHMWAPRFEKSDPAQPAWIMPPIANVGRGPSGLAHYPGTGDVFPKHGSFLMCDYPAGVRHVLVKPDGASFKVVEDSSLPVESVSIPDVAWGYDGRLYLADWGGGWGPNDKHGHLKVMTNEAAHQDQAVVIADVKSLFFNGFDKLSDEKLIELLGHQNQRVRLEAQYELSDLNRRVEDQLWQILTDEGKPELMRLHALWAAGMKARSDRSINELLDIIVPSSLGDPSEQIRAQAVKVLADLGHTERINLYEMLGDPSPVVQHQVAIAIGKYGQSQGVAALMDTLYDNDNHDVVIRHAASYGLSLIGDGEAIHHEMKRRGAAERLGGVLALRHLKSPLLAAYINDEDVQVAAEAVRAIYDQRIDEHLPTIAQLTDTLTPGRMIEPIMRRVIEANVRLADAESAERLASIAANADAPRMWRALAVQELTNWSATRNREDVWGWWMPRPRQDMTHASEAMQKHLPAIKATATGEVLTQARVFELTHILKAGPDLLSTLAQNTNEPDEVRMAGMQMLAEQDRKGAVTLAEELLALPSSTPSLRKPLRALLRRLDWQASLRADLHAFEHGTIAEQQEAIHQLAINRSGEAQKLMVKLGEQLQSGTLAPELRLDAYHVLTKYKNLPIASRFSARQYAEQNTLPGEAPFIREASLVGGSAERGRDVFLNNNTAQCQRCHAADGRETVGPGLNGIAIVHDASYLYDALVRPGAAIANGFANTSVRLKDGRTQSGRILADQSTDQVLVLTNADGVTTEIPRDQIDGVPTTSDQSLMPTMTDKLTPMELRDVLAYLGSLTDNPSTAYRAGGAADATAAGPQIVKAAAGMPHAIWLPAILLGIAASLFLLLMLTVWGARQDPITSVADQGFDPQK
jgi:quinoprotein glucose dehydrogenase